MSLTQRDVLFRVLDSLASGQPIPISAREYDV